MSVAGFNEFGCQEFSNTWKNNININSEEMGFEGVPCNNLNQEKIQCWALLDNRVVVSIQVWKFLNQQSDYSVSRTVLHAVCSE